MLKKEFIKSNFPISSKVKIDRSWFIYFLILSLRPTDRTLSVFLNFNIKCAFLAQG